MTTIKRSAPVMVTVATSYVSGLLVEKLLEQGLTVLTPVRDPNNPEKLKYLNEIAATTSDTSCNVYQKLPSSITGTR